MSNKKIITHNDYDGLLTLAFTLRFIGGEFEGFYDLTKIKSKHSFNLEDIKNKFFFVDADVNWCQSYGHHYLDLKEKIFNSRHLQSFNPNMDRKMENYFRKCPFNCAMVIMAKHENAREWLKNIIETDQDAVDIVSTILYGDSFEWIFRHYEENSKEWLDYYNLSFLKDFIEENKSQIKEKCCDIENELYNKIHQDDETYFQKVQNQEARVFNFILKKLKFNEVEIPNFNTYNVLEMEIQTCSLLDWNNMSDDEYKNVFSFARTSKDEVRYTRIVSVN